MRLPPLRFFSASEIRLGFRLIRRQPLMAATVVLALATGIGLATASFTFMDSVVDGTLPFEGGDRYVRFLAFTQKTSARAPIETERFRHFRDSAKSFTYLGALRGEDVNLLVSENQINTVQGAWLTPGWFSHLPYKPLLGRLLIPADGRPGARPVVLIRESFWKRQFARDPDIIGRYLDVSGDPHEIVGVMPDIFEFPHAGEIWMPLTEEYFGGSTPTDGPVAGFFGVLANGTSIVSAQREIELLSSQYDSRNATEEPLRVEVARYTDLSSIGIETALKVFLLLTVLVLLVIASNVANLILARTSARGPELAMRTALGASRLRLVMQLSLEVLLLGGIAALIGIGASRVALRYVEAGIGNDLPFWISLSPNLRTVVFVVFATLLATVVGGAIPALRATGKNLTDAIHSGSSRGGSPGFGRLSGLMIVTEMALSVALLSVAVVLVNGALEYSDLKINLPQEEILTAQVYIEPPADDGSSSTSQASDPREAVRRRQLDLAKSVERIPGVASVGLATHLPRMTPRPQPVILEFAEGDTTRISAPSVGVSTGFFETINGRATAGRLFIETDFEQGAAPVVIVNQPFVDKFLGGRNPVGLRLRDASSDATEDHWSEIVGVVPDLGLVAGDPALSAGYYEPIAGSSLFRIALRTRSNPLLHMSALQKAAFDLDPDIVVNRIVLLEDVAMEDRVAFNVMGAVMGGIGGVALLLSLVGMYAIVSFTVTRRTREIGIRLALGAGPLQILRSIVGRAGALLMVGGVIGAVFGAAFTRLRASILASAIPDVGPWVIPLLLSLLAAAGIAACWNPVRRALRVRPADALRSE